MALVGGIGSGKTTELRLTRGLLGRHKDAVTVLLDMAELTDINEINPGAILIAVGTRLYHQLDDEHRQEADVRSAYRRLRELAEGKTEWVEATTSGSYFEGEDPDYEPDLVQVSTPGLLRPRFPAIKRSVSEVFDLVCTVSAPLILMSHQVTILIDGLDRLIRPERFRLFAEQDLQALRGTGISLIIAAPLLMWFDKNRFLQEYFDEVKHIPAAVSDPEKSTFLNEILIRRGARDLMGEAEISTISKYSGGVLRDLITLARTSAEAAYRDDKNRIELSHVESAIRQLGKRYLIGIGRVQLQFINRLMRDEAFSIENPQAKELLVSRQVLEYFNDGRESFAVHPALCKVLEEAE